MNLLMRKGSAHPIDSRVSYLNLYEFDDLDLSSVAGLVVTSDCDQIFLERTGEELTAFVRAGGRIAVMGHVVTTHIGRSRVPLDYVHPLGEGYVLVHSGNDLTGWHSDDNSASRMSPQLFDWLAQR
ncbi:hypothetical protein [Rhodococcus sp. IEGM 1379]|uniref:hypothetical protein n=1 Tax=Rhodococcus sp. IEGM 1379 TaxID=3047086 RepID=UPI0024B77D1A|nr:hypothetical protein [Rhodococcus sp. IEGM 1379]MDI9916745.1 hypothetical protein [Rhodococcus sp. IEGM 1379]